MKPTRPAPGLPAGNPFSTRYTAPSAAGYLFPEAIDARHVVAKLGQSGWWGQIVGPHGSGKSTLLHTLLGELQTAGRSVVFAALHHSERRLPAEVALARNWDERTQVVIDGYEQLGWLHRIDLKRKCRARRAGLLVTAHRSVGMPMLWQTDTSTDLAWQIVRRLLDRCGYSAIDRHEVAATFRVHRGDMRETLMALYDVYEQRSRQE
jgi:hypothetical protein